MDRLRTMRTFCRVAETGSFSKAARQLGLSPALVSRQVSDLETHLGIRLLNRTTRQVSLSEAGQRYYQSCVELLEQIEELETSVSGLGQQPGGLLRISVPMDFGRLFLGQAIREFLSRAPQVRLEVLFDDRDAQLLQEQVDVAVRIGRLEDSSLIARRLGEACLACYASPDYLAERGAPSSLEELLEHNLLEYSLSRTPGSWVFAESHQATDDPGTQQQGPTSIALANRSRLSCNNGRALAEAASRGLGITRLPEFLVQDYVQSGQLMEVLSETRSAPMEIFAVYQHARHKPAKVTAFVDYLVAYFQRSEDWLPRPV